MDIISLYQKWLDTALFEEFYASLRCKHVSLLAPFVYDLLAKIRHQCSGAEHIFSSKTLSNAVAKHFESFWADKLVKLFSVELNYLEQSYSSPASNEIIFVQALNDIDYRTSFVERYPVLISLVEAYCANYQNFLCELIARVRDDHEEISAQFLNHRSFCITRIDLTGDAHHFGKHTAVLTYTDSQKGRGKLVYKPGRAANSEVFYKITDKIFELQNDHCIKPRILAKKTHYYSEFIKHLPCDDLKSVQLFYKRIGTLIAVTQLLKGHDIHFENIIAHGPYPVLIDCECLFTPEFQFVSHDAGSVFAMGSSVNFIGFIPTLHEKSDISALTGPYIYEHEEAIVPEIFKKFESKPEGQDKTNTPFSHNKPFCEGYEIDARDYLEYIISGYKEAYGLIESNAEWLFVFITETIRSFPVETRIVLKPTEYYSKFITEIFYPKNLRSQDALEGYLHLLQDTTKNLSIYASELQQLLNLDIPVFTLTAFEQHLIDGLNNAIPVYQCRNFLEILEDNFEHDINRENCQSNINLIQYSFGLREINMKFPESKKFGTGYSVQQAIRASLQHDIAEKQPIRLLNIAKLLLDATHDYAIYNRCYINWPKSGAVKLKDNKFIYYPESGDETLYDGSTGVLLTQYYGYKIFNDEKYRLFVIRQIKSVTEKFAKMTKLNAGAYTGIGQYLYILSVLEADFSKEITRLKELVFKWLHVNFDQVLLEDKRYDIVIGIAGLAVSLVRAHQIFPEDVPVVYLRQCGEYLCKNFDFRSNFFLGMSHGVAGIAWALHQIQPYVYSSFPTELIKKLLHIERSYFDIQNCNWPLFNEAQELFHSDSTYTTYWCHGAIGILLSRMDLYYRGYRDEILPYEVSLGLNSIKLYPMLRKINLCHGSLAWFDILLNAKKSNFDVDKDFEAACQFLIEELQKPDCSINHLGSLFDASLMTGHTGLAYQIMRITHPDKVPSVLLLETR